MNPKKNAYLAKRQNEIDKHMRIAVLFERQQNADALIIALHEEFGFGKDRCARALKALESNRKQIADLALSDHKCDKNIFYTKAVVDMNVRQVMGEDYPPWEERYKVYE